VSTSGSSEEPGGLIPPYDGRTKGPDDTETTSARTSSVERQLAETDAGKVGATASPANENPVDEGDVTQEAPETPLGVGESITTGGEEIEERDGKEPGRHDAGTQGRSQRPVGTSDPRSDTSIDP